MMMMTALALLLSTPDAAQLAEDGKTIIVTARSLADTQAALRNCLARKCPPAEDIEASAAHAENLFVAGRYEDAMSVLGDSIGRNKHYAKQLPVEVAGLYRAHSRVSVHLGHESQYRSSTYQIVRALKAGLPDDDAKVVAGRFEVAAMQLSLGKLRVARDTYGEIAGQAERIGRGDLSRIAKLRVAWIDFLLGDEGGARHKLRKMAADQAPEAKVSRISALVLLSRMDREKGKGADTDQLIAELKRAKLDKPVLLYSPPMQLKRSPIQDEAEVGNVLRLWATDTFEDKWVDVGFWVDADGRVREAEILRRSGDTDWTPTLMASISGRIYAPLKDPSGSYRVERYTYTSLWEARTGTRLKQRSANARVEMLDLSAD